MFPPFYDAFNKSAHAGTGVNAPLDKDGRTALHIAVEKNDRISLQKLLRVGADPDQKNNLGQSAVFEAITRRNMDLLELLTQKGASLALTDDARRTPLDWAIEQGCARDVIAKIESLGAPTGAAPESLKTPLHQAAERNRADLVEYFVRAGADINAQDKDGRTPLFSAIEAKSHGAADRLLQLGADPLRRNSDIRTPLHAAAAAGDETSAALLLSHPEVRRTINEFQTYSLGFTPLMEAVNGNHTAIAARIAAAGGDINATDHQKRNSLYIAVEQGNVESAALLLQLGADTGTGTGIGHNKSQIVHAIHTTTFRPMLALLYRAGVDLDARNGQGETPLTLACEAMDKDRVRALLELGANPNLANGYGRRPLDAIMDHYSYPYGGDHNEIINLLLQHGANPDLSPNPEVTCAPLHTAARAGNLPTLQSLVLHQARIDQPARTKSGATPLLAAVESGQVAAAKFLQDHGADAARTDNYKRGLLHFAARGGDAAYLGTLLAVPGANIEQADGRGLTPLHHACRRDKKEAAAALLRHGANPLALDQQGFTPLHHAIEKNYNPDVLDAFKDVLGAKADWNVQSADGDTLLHVAAKQGQSYSLQKLLDLGADPAKEGKHGLLPLHASILQGNDWITGLLLDAMKKHNVHPDQHKDKNGWTALHYASTRDQAGHAEKLIQAGADVNARAINGDTPLLIAARAGKDDLVRLLLSKGADPVSANNDGETAFDAAASQHRDYIVRLIAEEMARRPPAAPKPAPLIQPPPPGRPPAP